MRTALVPKGSFPATDDLGGRHAIYIFQEVVHIPDHPPIEGVRTLRTRDGKHVNRKDKGQYEIVESGLSLHSDARDQFKHITGFQRQSLDRSAVRRLAGQSCGILVTRQRAHYHATEMTDASASVLQPAWCSGQRGCFSLVRPHGPTVTSRAAFGDAKSRTGQRTHPSSRVRYQCVLPNRTMQSHPRDRSEFGRCILPRVAHRPRP